MRRSTSNSKSFQSNGSYHIKQIQITKSEILDKIKDYNNRKSSKEQTLNDLELIQRKIDAKLKSFRSN
jgi:hypothetical protein